MKKNVVLASTVLLVIFTAFLGVGRAVSQGSMEQGERVIQLSGTGRERGNSVTFTAGGDQLAVGGSSGIYFFDTEDLSRKAFIPTGTWARSVAISADGSMLAGGLYDNSVGLWQLPGLGSITSFTGLGGWGRSVAFSPDGRLLAAAAGNALRIWSVPGGRLQLEVDGLEGIRALAFSPDGRLVALGLENNSIELRSLPGGELVRSLLGHEGWIRCLAFSPDGEQLASGAFDATARLWNVETGELEYMLTDHDSSVLGIAYSPDGRMLATGSVDQTVRLWDPSTGSLLRTLVGHDGFVYSVAFSPDGDVVASGGNDNTVRLWDIGAAPDGAAQAPETPSDCRACHHPLGNTSPPAVVDVSCEACHTDGLAFNWCPYFPRTVREGSKVEIVTASHEPAGLSIPSESLAVTIFSPANGERAYSSRDYVAPFQVRGDVRIASGALDGIELQLEIWDGAQKLSTLVTTPQPNGQFAFSLGVNPNGNRLRINDPAAPFNCAYCHDDYFVEAVLPAGPLRLRVTATTPDGEQAVDERMVTTDVGEVLPYNVTLEDSATGQPAAGLTVQAGSILYEWRGRTSTAISNSEGKANLALEVLSQAATTYQVIVPDQVVEGVFYSGQEMPIITFDPRGEGVSPIKIEVTSTKGRITGSLGNAPTDPLDIWAVQLPIGPWLKTSTGQDGDFAFLDIPVGKYVVFADPGMMSGHGLAGSRQVVDLTASPDLSTRLEAGLAASNLTGTLSSKEGEWVPFAWVEAPDRTVYPVDPQSGEWNASAPDDGAWLVTAPGYYSRRVDISRANSWTPQQVTLLERPEMRSLEWGQGQILVPPETQAKVGEGVLDFDAGWVWGSNPVDREYVIRLDEGEIRMHAGKFALEREPGGTAWLYVFAGSAEVHASELEQGRTIEAGEMAALERAIVDPFPYAAQVVPALHSEDEAPLTPIWEPSLREKAKNLSSQIGVILAQFVTFITYLIAIFTLVIAPLLAIRWLIRNQRSSGAGREQK